MNINLQYVPRNWLKIIIGLSGSIFLLSLVALSDRAFDYLWKKYISEDTILYLWDTPQPFAVTISQYLVVIIFIYVATRVFANKPVLWSFIFLLVYGFLTYFFVVLIPMFSYNCCAILPATGGGGDESNKIIVYISTFSGLIAAISGLYGQITAGRKAMAEVELEKLRLQVEQEKAKAKNGKRQTIKPRKQP